MPHLSSICALCLTLASVVGGGVVDSAFADFTDEAEILRVLDITAPDVLVAELTPQHLSKAMLQGYWQLGPRMMEIVRDAGLNNDQFESVFEYERRKIVSQLSDLQQKIRSAKAKPVIAPAFQVRSDFKK
jgi:hypothetical protein